MMPETPETQDEIRTPTEAELRRARRQRLIDAEPEVVEPVSTRTRQQASEPEMLEAQRPSGWKVIERVPNRPETLAEERARYDGRLKDHERRLRRWQERQTPEARREDVIHRMTCEVELPCPHPAHAKLLVMQQILPAAEARRLSGEILKTARTKAAKKAGLTPADRTHLLRQEGSWTPGRCEHPSHVREPRKVQDATRRDQRHLLGCSFEEGTCPNHADAHLLPPRPLDIRLEFCCAQKCYPFGTVQALTACLNLRPSVRRQRQAELRRNPQAFGDARSVAAGGFDLVKVNRLGSSVRWAMDASSTIHDETLVPLRSPAE
jgi:hypothetical protein